MEAEVVESGRSGWWWREIRAHAAAGGDAHGEGGPLAGDSPRAAVVRVIRGRVVNHGGGGAGAVYTVLLIVSRDTHTSTASSIYSFIYKVIIKRKKWQ
jgi:hypothetical protein